MTEILFRRETADETLAVGATHLDDIDLVVSPRDNLLVIVAVKNGRHVCQQCGELFAEADFHLRPVEVLLYPGSPRVMLHAKCQSKPSKVHNVFKGLQIRRSIAKVAKSSESLYKAAGSAVDAARKIVAG